MLSQIPANIFSRLIKVILINIDSQGNIDSQTPLCDATNHFQWFIVSAKILQLIYIV